MCKAPSQESRRKRKDLKTGHFRALTSKSFCLLMLKMGRVGSSSHLPALTSYFLLHLCPHHHRKSESRVPPTRRCDVRRSSSLASLRSRRGIRPPTRRSTAGELTHGNTTKLSSTWLPVTLEGTEISTRVMKPN